MSPISPLASRFILFLAACVALLAPHGFAQENAGNRAPVVTPPPSIIQDRTLDIAAGLAGLNVEAVEVRGNEEVPTATILNAVRTRPGDALDPQTVEDDYQRIYALRKFSNVQAKLEPTQTGVIVVFIVAEQRTITAVGFRGNVKISEQALRDSIDIRPGEAVDNFRIALARRTIEAMYKTKNYPFSSITIDADALSNNGELIFVITEGPNVRVRNIDFPGATAFDEDTLKKQIRTKNYIPILRPGTLDEEMLEDDAASLREFFRSKGFFDARVGYRTLFSDDLKSVQIEFLVDQGMRYTIESITIRGAKVIGEAQIREKLRLLEGMPFDRQKVDRDVRAIVDLYAPTGMIYEPSINDPDFLRVSPLQRFRLEPGTIELIYDITEGKAFTVGNVEVRGNTRTQDKVVLRELRLLPGELYNATTARRGNERLQATRLFDSIRVTPVGEDDDSRDILVEVAESKTALFTFGAGVSSNGGVSGNVTYRQSNFDITRFPTGWTDITSENAFIGAGQKLTISLEPGTERSNAFIRWYEPYLFDQDYDLVTEAYLRDRVRRDYREQYIGGRFAVGRRFAEYYRVSLGPKIESVRIYDIDDPDIRAQEILDAKGTSFVTSLTGTISRDTTNPGVLKYEGTNTGFSWESFGVFGGDYTFQKFTGEFSWYTPLYRDLLDRPTVLSFHIDAGYITGESALWERFYGGGFGSLRGFRYRGVSPRSGPDDDAIGGEFSLTGTVELSYPIYRDNLRGVFFVDGGTVESDFEFNTFRSSAGFGIRITVPIFGQVPIAVDYAFPITYNDQDDTQRISFSLGFIP